MRILGIVAEYDPFHRGHAWHLAEARRQVQPDWTLVALSGCIKQRGEFSLLSPHDRAASAVEAGADAVFELPLLWTVRDAEHYALGAVSLLAMLGCTHLAFGAETDRLNRLQQLGDRAWLYIVTNCKTKPELHTFWNPIERMNFTKLIKGVQFYLPLEE